MQKTPREVTSVEEAPNLGLTAATIREQARENRLPGRKVGPEKSFAREALL